MFTLCFICAPHVYILHSHSIFATEHFIISHKTHHMPVDQTFLLLVSIEQGLLADVVDLSRNTTGNLIDLILRIAGKQLLLASRIRQMSCDVSVDF